MITKTVVIVMTCLGVPTISLVILAFINDLQTAVTAHGQFAQFALMLRSRCVALSSFGYRICTF